MPAEVEEVMMFGAYCPECDWGTENYADEGDAEDAAFDHNEKVHAASTAAEETTG